MLMYLRVLSLNYRLYENLSSGFENNKGTDQPAHTYRLITFVISLLESIISRFAANEISVF